MTHERIIRIAEDIVKCPLCGEESLRLSIFLYDAPYIGKIIVQTGRCSSCGSKWSNVGLAEYSKPKRILLQVKGTNELNALVVKTAEATIKIPELGIEITPGPVAQGYITTVEGVLHRVLEHVPTECLNEASECYPKVQRIREAAEGQHEFTLIIEDPSGRSAITGEKIQVVEEELK